MSRSKNKYHPLYIKDFKIAFINLVFGKKKKHIRFSRETFNNWNCHNLIKIYQGKKYVQFKPTVYHIGEKFGVFIKTRKPFFFRSKKKKN